MNRRRFLADGIASAAAGWVTSEVGSSETLPTESPRSPERVVRLTAKPTQIDIDLARTAVVVVDKQNDFCSKGGLLYQLGVDISITQRAIAPTAVVLSPARKASLKIIYLKMAFQPDLSDLGPHGSPNWIDNRVAGGTTTDPNGAQSRILIRDTWNTDIIAELRPEPADTIIYKNRSSGFYQTDLDAILKRWGTRFLVVTGCTTSVCVESTIRDAVFRDYSPVLLADCTAEPKGYGLPRSNYEATLFIIESQFGWVSTSEEFVHAVARAAASG
jgi:ureidoacrylate peracid hydrolase